jgi:hypothetical protein
LFGHQRTTIFCLAKTLLSLTPRFSGVQRWGGQVGNRFTRIFHNEMRGAFFAETKMSWFAATARFEAQG